jgi:hypothetical protein
MSASWIIGTIFLETIHTNLLHSDTKFFNTSLIMGYPMTSSSKIVFELTRQINLCVFLERILAQNVTHAIMFPTSADLNPRDRFFLLVGHVIVLFGRKHSEVIILNFRSSTSTCYVCAICDVNLRAEENSFKYHDFKCSTSINTSTLH